MAVECTLYLARPRQHTRMLHGISQKVGNNSESDDSDIDSILEMVKCLQVLGTSKQCIAYCNYIFTTKEECYKHKFLSTSQCCQTIISNLKKSSLDEGIKKVGIQQIVLKVKSVYPQLWCTWVPLDTGGDKHYKSYTYCTWALLKQSWRNKLINYSGFFFMS